MVPLECGEYEDAPQSVFATYIRLCVLRFCLRNPMQKCKICYAMLLCSSPISADSFEAIIHSMCPFIKYDQHWNIILLKKHIMKIEPFSFPVYQNVCSQKVQWNVRYLWPFKHMSRYWILWAVWLIYPKHDISSKTCQKICKWEKKKSKVRSIDDVYGRF